MQTLNLQITSSAALSTATETEAKSSLQERICCKEEDTVSIPSELKKKKRRSSVQPPFL